MSRIVYAPGIPSPGDAVHALLARSIAVGQVAVEITDTGECRYEAGCAIDCDGAPGAYALPGSGLTGLDYIRNALHRTDDALVLDDEGHLVPPEHGWAGILTDAQGAPLLQLDGPYQGYCLSPTALCDEAYPLDDRRRYVDATTIAYVSVPPELRAEGVCLGDAALVASRRTGRSIQAVVADIGPRRRLGEISVACAAGIGIPSSPKNGGASSGVLVRIFCGSHRTPAWSYSAGPAEVAAFVDGWASRA